LQDRFEDSKVVIRRCESKDRQHNGQKKMDKKTMFSNFYDIFTFSAADIREVIQLKDGVFNQLS
jgi:hypothetical protein